MNAREIRIAEPCKVDWKSMTPAEGGRFCGECKKVVRNLSQMSEREAKKLLRTQNDGQLCVRFVYDERGRIWFGKDAPRVDPLLPAAMLSRAKRVAAMASVAFATQACEAVTSVTDAVSSSTEAEEPEQYERMMGGAPADFEAHAEAEADAGEGDAADGGADAADAGADAASDFTPN